MRNLLGLIAVCVLLIFGTFALQAQTYDYSQTINNVDPGNPAYGSPEYQVHSNPAHETGGNDYTRTIDNIDPGNPAYGNPGYQVRVPELPERTQVIRDQDYTRTIHNIDPGNPAYGNPDYQVWIVASGAQTP